MHAPIYLKRKQYGSSAHHMWPLCAQDNNLCRKLPFVEQFEHTGQHEVQQNVWSIQCKHTKCWVGYAFVHMSPDLVCQNRLRCPVATAITQGALRPEQKASSKHISPLSYCHPLVQSGLASNVLTCPILPL